MWSYGAENEQILLIYFFFSFFSKNKKKKYVIQARIASDLIELRNKSVFAFFMFNALFVLVVFLMQLNKDQLHIIWPYGVRTNVTFIEETAEVSMALQLKKKQNKKND